MEKIGLLLLLDIIQAHTITNILLLIIRPSQRDNHLNQILFGFQKQSPDSTKPKMSLKRSFKEEAIGLVIISPTIKKSMKKLDSRLNSNRKETNIPTTIVQEERCLIEMQEKLRLSLI